jgi:glutathione peroxidase-family protein
MKRSFYDFSIKSLQGKEISMESFRRKLVLIDNNGNPMGRFRSPTEPPNLAKYIEDLVK